MKRILITLALAGAAVACKSQSTEVTDTSAPAATTECAAECTEGMKGECSDAAKAECSSEAKTCPVTGKVIN